MNELIKIETKEINEKLVQTVNARELRKFLEVGTRYNDWISKRVKDYDFIENQDFIITTEKKYRRLLMGIKLQLLKNTTSPLIWLKSYQWWKRG